MIEIIKTILFGIVEGITEWLPISSTGHMILINEFMKLNVTEEFWNMFLVVIQLGAIMAVVVLYFNELNPFSSKKNNEEKKDTWNMWFKILVAVIPAAIVGFLLDDFMEEHLYTYQVVAAALIVYGILFIIIEKANKNRSSKVYNIKSLSYKDAILIGLFQTLALIPGTSRSGSTILGATLIGTSRSVAAEFSFFLAIPVMLGASLLKLVKFGFNFTMPELVILAVGMLTAFFVSILAIKFLMKYIKKNDFTVFGWYRIVLGALVILYFIIFK